MLLLKPFPSRPPDSIAKVTMDFDKFIKHVTHDLEVSQGPGHMPYTVYLA